VRLHEFEVSPRVALHCATWEQLTSWDSEISGLAWEVT
jgi:hypothetical protein